MNDQCQFTFTVLADVQKIDKIECFLFNGKLFFDRKSLHNHNMFNSNCSTSKALTNCEKMIC